MKICEMTARTGCPAETIRFYEAEGLLHAPERASNNYREYGEEHVSRVSFVMRCRSLDMAHDEIRVLLRLQDEPGTPCDEVRAMLDEHASHVDARIAELSALKDQIQHIRDACADGECIGACGALESLRHTTGANPATARPRSGGASLSARATPVLPKIRTSTCSKPWDCSSPPHRPRSSAATCRLWLKQGRSPGLLVPAAASASWAW